MNSFHHETHKNSEAYQINERQKVSQIQKMITSTIKKGEKPSNVITISPSLRSQIYERQKVSQIQKMITSTIKKGRKKGEKPSNVIIISPSLRSSFKSNLLQYQQTCTNVSDYQCDKNIVSTVLTIYSNVEIDNISSYSKYKSQTDRTLSEGDIQLMKGQSLSPLFIENVEDILRELKKKFYIPQRFLAKGGEGEVFSGISIKNNQELKKVVFKLIYYDPNNQADSLEAMEETKILKRFEGNLNIIKQIDFINIKKGINALILEKCKESLQQKLEDIQNTKLLIFDIEMLCKIFLDLLAGLIQMRIYKVIHLDIKPNNILISMEDVYIYSDFGISTVFQKNEKQYAKGYTKTYAPKEITMKSTIDYKSDVYSLGVTFQNIIDVYKSSNLVDMQREIVIQLEEIVEKQMRKQDINDRSDCLQLHRNIFEIFVKHNKKIVFEKCSKVLEQIIDLPPYDPNKDIQFFSEIKLYYLNIYLNFKDYPKIQENEINTHSKDSPDIQGDVVKIVFYQQRQAALYSYLGRYKEALDSLKKSLKTFKQNFKQNYLFLSASHIQIGKTYSNLGQYKTAFEHIQKAQSILQQNSVNSLNFKEIQKQNANHDIQLIHQTQSASIINFLSSYYNQIGDSDEAFKYLQLYQAEIHKFVQPSKLEINIESQEESLTNLENINNDIPSKPSSSQDIPIKDDIMQCQQQQELNLLEIQQCSERSLTLTKKTSIICLHETSQTVLSSQQDELSLLQTQQDSKSCLDQTEKSLNIYSFMIAQSGPTVSSVSTFRSDSTVSTVFQDDTCFILKKVKRTPEQIYQDLEIFFRNIIKRSTIPSSVSAEIKFLFEKIERSFESSQKEIKSQYLRELKYWYLSYADSLSNRGMYHLKKGDYKKAFEYYYKSLQIKRKLFPSNFPNHSIIGTLNTIGSIQSKLGLYNKAFQLEFDILRLRKEIFYNPHPHIAISLNNIGVCYQVKTDHQSALKYLLQSLEMRRQLFGPEDHLQIANSLSNVGHQYLKLGDYLIAQRFLSEALEMKKQIYVNQNHPEISSSLNDLGKCYKSLGNFQQALQCFKQSYGVLSGVHRNSASHPEIAITLANIGSIYSDLGIFKEALEHKIKSQQMLESIYERDHPALITILNNIGSSYSELGNLNKAKEYVKQSYKRMIRLRINRPELTSTIFNNLATIYLKLGQIQKAILFYEKSLELLLELNTELGSQIPDIVTSLNNLGICYLKFGDYQNAQKYFLDSFKIKQDYSKVNNFELIQSHKSLALFYSQIQKTEIAQYFIKALHQEKNNNLKKQKITDKAEILSTIAQSYFNLDRFQQALRYSGQSLKWLKTIFQSSSHPQVAQNLFRIGVCYKELGQPKVALKYLEEGCQMNEQIFKANHHSTLSFLFQIAHCYYQLGQFQQALERMKDLLDLIQKTGELYESDLNNLKEQTILSISECYLWLGDYDKALLFFLEFFFSTKIHKIQDWNICHSKDIFGINGNEILLEDQLKDQLKRSTQRKESNYQLLVDINEFDDNLKQQDQLRSRLTQQNNTKKTNTNRNQIEGNQKIKGYFQVQLNNKIIEEKDWHSKGKFTAQDGNVNSDAQVQQIQDFQNSLRSNLKQLSDVYTQFGRDCKGVGEKGKFYSEKLCDIFGAIKQKLSEWFKSRKQIQLNSQESRNLEYQTCQETYQFRLWEGQQKIFNFSFNQFQQKNLSFKKLIDNHLSMMQSNDTKKRQFYPIFNQFEILLVNQLKSVRQKVFDNKTNQALVATQLSEVGWCYLNLYDYQNMLNYQLESLQMRTQLLQPNHIDIISSLQIVGYSYLLIKDFSKAYHYFQKSLSISKVSQNTKQIVISIYLLGTYYYADNNFEVALEYFLKSLEIAECLEEGYKLMIFILENIYLCNLKLQKPIEALEIQVKLLQMNPQIFENQRQQKKQILKIRTMLELEQKTIEESKQKTNQLAEQDKMQQLEQRKMQQSEERENQSFQFSDETKLPLNQISTQAADCNKKMIDEKQCNNNNQIQFGKETIRKESQQSERINSETETLCKKQKSCELDYTKEITNSCEQELQMKKQLLKDRDNDNLTSQNTSEKAITQNSKDNNNFNSNNKIQQKRNSTMQAIPISIFKSPNCNFPKSKSDNYKSEQFVQCRS